MSHKFFQNKECEYFPCKRINTDCGEKLNCLFCFCPLYYMEDCGGVPVKLKNGIRSCSNCILPHREDGYDLILEIILEQHEEANHE